MLKRRTRVVALLLAVLMIFSQMPSDVWAEQQEMLGISAEEELEIGTEFEAEIETETETETETGIYGVKQVAETEFGDESEEEDDDDENYEGEPVAVDETGDDSTVRLLAPTGTLTLTGTATAPGTDDSWTTSNEWIAKVSSNNSSDGSATVEGVSVGAATITHKYYVNNDNGITESTETFMVTVCPVVNHFKLSSSCSNVIVYVEVEENSLIETTGEIVKSDLVKLLPGQEIHTSSKYAYLYYNVVTGYAVAATFEHYHKTNAPTRTEFPIAGENDLDNDRNTFEYTTLTANSTAGNKYTNYAYDNGCNYESHYTSKSGLNGNYWVTITVKNNPIPISIKYEDGEVEGITVPVDENIYYHKNITETELASYERKFNILGSELSTENGLFKGWVGLDGKIYNPGDTCNIADIWNFIQFEKDTDGVIKSGTFILKAIKSNQYTVSYDGNGAERGYVSDRTVYNSGDHVKLAANEFYYTSEYEFVGWCEQQTCTDGKLYQAGDNYIITQDTTFYAQWVPTGKCIIRYLAGDNGRVTNTYDTVEQNATAADNGSEAIADQGYKFVKWMNVSDDNETYTDAQFKPTLNKVSERSEWPRIITYKAVFERIKYKVTYDEQNGKDTYTDETVYYYGNNVTVTNTVPTWDNHAFKYWTLDKDGNGTQYSRGEEIKNITGDITLYAQWSENGGGSSMPGGGIGGTPNYPSGGIGSTPDNSGTGDGGNDNGNVGDNGDNDKDDTTIVDGDNTVDIVEEAPDYDSDDIKGSTMGSGSDSDADDVLDTDSDSSTDSTKRTGWLPSTGEPIDLLIWVILGVACASAAIILIYFAICGLNKEERRRLNKGQQ